MKDFNKSVQLALLGGTIGLHRFYLGQVGKAIKIILWTVLSFGITGNLILGILLGATPSLITAAIWLLNNQEDFDTKYNSQAIQREILKNFKK